MILTTFALGCLFSVLPTAQSLSYDFNLWKNNGTTLMCAINAPEVPSCYTQLAIDSFQQVLDKRNDGWQVTWPPEYLQAETAEVDQLIGKSRSLARFKMIKGPDDQYKIDIAYEKDVDLILARNTYRKDRTFWPWSEVAFAFYKHFYTNVPADFGKSLRDLKGVVRRYIVYPPVADLINDTLASTTGDPNFPPGKLREIKPPSDYFYALVGSAHGRGPAYMLLQHRPELGHKTIELVEIWQSSDGWHSLIFRFRDYVWVLVDNTAYQAYNGQGFGGFNFLQITLSIMPFRRVYLRVFYEKPTFSTELPRASV